MRVKKLSIEELNNLPQEVINKAKETLKAYDMVTIVFEYGEYKVQTGNCITNEYAEDHKVIGNVYANDIFTEAEKIINYIEAFAEYPIQYKGKRDYNMLRELENLHQQSKQGLIQLDENGNASIKEIINID